MSANRESRGIDLATLVITAVASAAAAYACSKVWAPGTLLSAAFTPVLVAVIKEGLQRPTEVVSRAVPVRGVVRSARTQSEGPERRRDTPDEVPTRVAPNGEIQSGEIPDNPRPSRNAARWRLAIITGLLGFVICALVLTVPELVAGESASGGGRQTTLFGGETKKKKRERTTPTTTTTTPAPAPAGSETTPEPTQTAPPPAVTAPDPATDQPPPVSTAPTPTTPAPAPPAPVGP